ncbi:MAG: sensor histidine kinase, partial [Desulfonatronovibrio sp.]
FSIIAHDLKSPMASLLSSTEMLADQTEIFNEEEIKILSRDLHKNALNTFALLEDLLQWSRMNQGAIDYAPEPCSLDALINTSLNSSRDIAERKNITIENHTPQDMTVLVDQPMIKTVIRNIIFNAVKFTPRGKNISITAVKTSSFVEVCVQDDGI